MFFICLPSCPQHRSLSLHHCSPFSGHFFIFTFYPFFCLNRTLSYYLIVLLDFLSFHLPPALSPTHPLSLFSKPSFPSHDFHFHFSYDVFFHPTLASAPCLSWPVSALFSHISAAFLVFIYCSTLPTGRLFLSYVVLLLDSLCSCLFIPSVSNILFVLILSETEAQAVRGSYQPQ